MRDRLKRALKRRVPVLVNVRDRLRPRPTAEPPREVPSPVPPPSTDGLTMEAVLELVDDMVRPALQDDGGDIEIVRIEDGDVYVRLMGACVGCPSSRATLQGGVERLMAEELEGFRSLIELPAL